MAGGAPLDEALPALVETVVRELDWERGALWLLDAPGELRREAAWPAGSAPAEPPELPAEPMASSSGHRHPGRERRRHARPARARAATGQGALGDELAGFAAALGRRRSASSSSASAPRSCCSTRRCTTRSPGCPTGCCSSIASTTRSGGCSASTPRSPCSSSTSTASRRSTIASATPAATRCSSAPPIASAAALRAEDTVARFGGDELVVLSEHVAGAAGGALIAERILEQLRAPIDVDGEQVTLSASIGICVAPIEGATRDELLRTADAAMYEAKAGGPGALRHRGGVTASPSPRPFAPSRRRRAAARTARRRSARARRRWPARASRGRCRRCPTGG